MTELLEQAIERVRSFPPEAQDDFARVLLRLAGDETEIVALTQDEQAAIAASKAAAARGDFATDEEVRAVLVALGDESLVVLSPEEQASFARFLVARVLAQAARGAVAGDEVVDGI